MSLAALATLAVPAVLPILLAGPVAFLILALVGACRSGLRPAITLQVARWSALAGLLSAAMAIAVLIANGPVTSTLIGWHGVGLSVRLDLISVSLYALIAFVGVVVLRYSENYLDGDPRQGAFLGGLGLALATVMLLVTAANLAQLVAAWVATSLALHPLLVFYRDREKAERAALKKFLIARVSDVALVASALGLVATYGTTDIATLLASAAAGEGEGSAVLAWAGLGLVLAAILKSAQFPVHGWLTEVMETPTPVSALLHAGIVNAGGFLIVRFADVMLLAGPALHGLALVGGFTALLGGLAMLTQTSVKVSLAWSTVSQMGFMLLQCGIGLFSLALLHILAHSLYKAHAFLSAGDAVRIQASVPSAVDERPGLPHALAGLLLALGLYAGLGALFGRFASLTPQALALGVILVLGLSLLLARAGAGRPQVAVWLRGGFAALGVSVAYFALQAGMAALAAGQLPPPPPLDAAGAAILGLTVASFLCVTLVQVAGARASRHPVWAALRIHLAAGLYANALFDRLLATRRAHAG